MRRALFALCVVAVFAVACSSDRQLPSAGDNPLTLCEITVAPASTTVAVGDSVQFTATTCDRLGVRWASTDTTKAVVAQAGFVRGVGKGVVTIIATAVADSTVKGAASLAIHSP